MSLSVAEKWQLLQSPGTHVKPLGLPVVASATSIDLSADANIAPVIQISGTTDIANIKPPYETFQGCLRFLFPDATPPDFVSGGSPAAGYYGVALTKSMARYEVVELWLLGILWYPAMT